MQGGNTQAFKITLDFGVRRIRFVNCSAHTRRNCHLDRVQFQKLIALLFSTKIMVLLNRCQCFGCEGNASHDSQLPILR